MNQKERVMAFHEFDPLFGSVGLCPSAQLWMQTTWSDSSDHEHEAQPARGRRKRKRPRASVPEGPSASNGVAAGGPEGSEGPEGTMTRFQYHETEHDMDRWRQERVDRQEREAQGETECLLCSMRDPDGSGRFQEVLDYYERNRDRLHPDILHQEVCRKYQENVRGLLVKRKGERCTLPLLEPRHLRQHESVCKRGVYDDAEKIADRLKERILTKLTKGIQVDTQTGLQEIVPIDTDRAIKSWLSLARFMATRPDSCSSSTTTISVNSSKKGKGGDASVSVSALVGMQKEKRQKRLDSYTLSRWNN